MTFKETKNFSVDELNCHLHPFLLTFLQMWRSRMDVPIQITSALRDFQDHVAVYKRQYPGDWHKKITLNSAHLPYVDLDGNISPYCHAVDFQMHNAQSHDAWEDEIQEFIKNSWIADLFPEESTGYGLGVAKNFIHLDCHPDRGGIVVWRY